MTAPLPSPIDQALKIAREAECLATDWLAGRATEENVRQESYELSQQARRIPVHEVDAKERRHAVAVRKAARLLTMAIGNAAHTRGEEREQYKRIIDDIIRLKIVVTHGKTEWGT